MDDGRSFVSVSTWNQPLPKTQSHQRRALLEHLAKRITGQTQGRLRVAVDGPTGAGKTIFSDELAVAIRNLGRSTARACLDDFKHPWRHAHEHGYDRITGQGYYRNAYDLGGIAELLLIPAGHGGSGEVALCGHDPLTGIDHRDERVQLLDDTVLIVDSVFAARPELVEFWDILLWLEVDDQIALSRGIERDAKREGVHEARELHSKRYSVAQSFYMAQANPRGAADVMIDNTKIDEPFVITDHRFIEELRAAHEQANMVGWDFSQLDGKLTADHPWWDFEADCVAAMHGATRIVDLGTGGGERLLRLCEQVGSPEAKTITATEGWEPNLPQARQNLAPAGIQVHSYDAESGDSLPDADGSVDLIMARHEAIDAAEIARVLAPGGKLLTQQVEGFDAKEIHEWFGSEFLYPHVTAPNYVAKLQQAGMRIDHVDEWQGVMRFADVEALVRYVGFVPWDAPDFSVDSHATRLLELAGLGEITVTQRRFRVYATKL